MTTVDKSEFKMEDEDDKDGEAFKEADVKIHWMR